MDDNLCPNDGIPANFPIRSSPSRDERGIRVVRLLFPQITKLLLWGNKSKSSILFISSFSFLSLLLPSSSGSRNSWLQDSCLHSLPSFLFFPLLLLLRGNDTSLSFFQFDIYSFLTETSSSPVIAMCFNFISLAIEFSKWTERTRGTHTP